MARVLGVNRDYVKVRLKELPHLRVVAPEDPEAPIQQLTPASTMLRAPTPGVQAPTAADTAAAIKKTELMIHQGLENFGVSKETLQKLRSLGDVAVTTGDFLAQSVIDTQTLYTIELYKIPDRLEYIRKNYLDKTDLPVMEQMFWQRAYTELLEQLGKGKDRMIEGTQAIGAMMRAAAEKNGQGKKPGERKVKPAW